MKPPSWRAQRSKPRRVCRWGLPRSLAVLTGAGVSAESGVPTFRGAGGLWRTYRAKDLATPGAFRRDPVLVWEWYDWRRGIVAGCQPNAAHYTLPEIPPRCPDCGALARPDVVWFGEPLPGEALDAACHAARRCQVMLVVGTSALVPPAASLPLLALERGAHVVEINPQPTPLSERVDEALRESAATALPRRWRAWLGDTDERE